jgi:preprotein translocase subunit SecY
MAIRNLSNLRAPKRANENKKRVGRGMGSGMGKTSTRGHKGQGSRSGSSLMRGFEGGQMPLHRRLPKRGFTNIFRVEYQVLGLDRVAEIVAAENVTEFTLDKIIALGLLRKKGALIKVLNNGEIKTAVTVHAHKFSKTAQEAIEKAGRKRVLFTLGMLAVYRLGSHIPTPGINADMLAQFFNQNSGSALGLVDLFSGGNLRKLTVFALGIMPYITASIIFQLLTVIYEPLAKLQKEGELGRRKITQWTRYVTVLLGVVQSFAIALTLTNTSTGQTMVTIARGAFIPLCVITLTAGTAFIMWLGEQITERGIGNGMSLLIFAGIVVGLPKGIEDLYEKVRDNAWGAFTPIAVALLVVGMIAVVAFIVFVERSERRIPVQYAKRIVGRKMMGGQSTHLPLRVNSGGVMPVIFASSILSAPLLFSGAHIFGYSLQDSSFFGPILRALAPGEPWYELLQMVAIIFFAYFYISIVFRPDDIADNMRKYGGFIPGIRPGKRTADFINDVLTRITLVGALYLVVITIIPQMLISGIHFNHLWLIGSVFDRLPTWMTNGLGVNFYFGGTSLLIVVGVAMDTVQQVESQLIMRHYDGFTPKSGRIRGRKSW